MGDVIQFRSRRQHLAMVPNPLVTAGMIQLAIVFGVCAAFALFMVEAGKR